MAQLEALENLRQVQVLTVAAPECDPDYRKALLTRWEAIASGIDPDHDEQGRFIVRSGADLRHWLVAAGGFAEEEVA